MCGSLLTIWQDSVEIPPFCLSDHRLASMILTDISSPAGVDLSLIVQLKTTNNSLEHSVVVIYGPLKVTEEPAAWCGWEQRRFGEGMSAMARVPLA